MGRIAAGAACRALWLHLLLAGATTAGTCLALEVGLRLALAGDERRELAHVGLSAEGEDVLRWAERRAEGGDGMRFDQHDPLLGWRPVAGIRRRNVRPGVFDSTVTTTVDGIRGGRVPGPVAAAGVTRLAVLGCSQTFGAEVDDEETWSARLEAAVPGTEVLNFGVHGFGTDQMLLRFERDVVRYRPDVVVLGFAYYHVERNARRFKFWWKPRFELVDGSLVLANVPVPAPADFDPASIPSPHRLLDDSLLLRWSWTRVRRLGVAAVQRPGSEAWRVTEALLRRFADGARRTGARPVLFDLEESRPPVSALLARIAAESHMALVDASGEPLDQYRRGVRMRLQGDVHWSPTGHAVLARVLRDGLCRQGLVPAC